MISTLKRFVGIREDDWCPGCYEPGRAAKSENAPRLGSVYICTNESCPVNNWNGWVDYGATWGGE